MRNLNVIKLLCLFTVISACVLLISCVSSTGSYSSLEKVDVPYIVGTFDENIVQYHGLKRNPIIIIHGLQGSKLENSNNNRNLWGYFNPRDVFYSDAERIQALAYPIKKGVPIEELKDDVVSMGILKKVDVNILGLQLQFPAYDVLLNALKDVGYSGYVPEYDRSKDRDYYHTMFEFSYDWRRDIPDNARMLQVFIAKKREYLRKKYKILYGINDYDVQFDIVAHSMGGLLARYYLRYGSQNLPSDGRLPVLDWAGSEYIDRAIIVGTPNAGYLDTFLEMLEGGQIQALNPALLGSIPSYYEMFPAPATRSVLYSDDPDGKSVDIFDPQLWAKMNWGILNPSEDKNLRIMLPQVKTREERYDLAYDHLSKCLKRAKQFIEAMKIDVAPPENVDLFLAFGNGIKTTRRVFINRQNGEIENITYASGDGKVTAISALWDLRDYKKKENYYITTPIDWSNIFTVRAAHMGILNSDSFIDNMLILLPMQKTSRQERSMRFVTETKRQKSKIS